MSKENPDEAKGGDEHILFVDDEESILNSTAELSRDYGYTVSKFQESNPAFKAFKTAPEKFDLIITDMTMPDMTGLEFSLKVFEIQQGMPIILCTGYSDNISEDKALKMGISKYLQKPIDSQMLLMTIRQILDKPE